MSFTVKATGTIQGGTTGLLLRVKVVTGAKLAASQPGGSASATGNPVSFDQSVTIAATGSWVYGACSDFTNNNSFTADARTTLIDNVGDATSGDQWGTFRSTSTTSSTGATTYGCSSPTADAGGVALAEILALTSLAEDASSPAVVSSTAATNVTTAAFTPPAGSLLVALVAANSGASTATTMAMSDTSGLGLTWTEVKKANGLSLNYSGVWIAQMPAASGSFISAVVRPSDTWFERFGPSSGHPTTKMIIPLWVPAVTSASVSDSDASGTTVDAGELIKVVPASGEASGTAADGGESIAATLASQDTSGSNDQGTTVGLGAADASGTAAEASVITATLASSDASGAGADGGELIRVIPASGEISGSTDGGESIAVTLASQDASGSNDQGTTVGLGSADASGAGADGGEQVLHEDFILGAALASDTWFERFGASAGRPKVKLVTPLFLSLAGTLITDSDAGHGTDAGEAVAATLADAETSTGTEASTIAATLASQDISGSADQGTTVGVGAADASGQALDGSEIIDLASSDAESAVESGTIAASLSGSDTETASEASSITASLASSDASGAGLDAGEQLLHEDFVLGTQQPGWSFIVRYGSLFRLTKPQTPVFWPSGGVVVTDADHCLGEDAEIDNPGAIDSDGMHGTDGGEVLAPAVHDSDTSSSHDGGETLGGTQLVSDTDSCHGTDAGGWSGPLSDSDAGHGTDLEVANRTFTDSDFCTGTDSHIVDVYAFQPPFRFTGGGFEVVKRPERAEPPPPRALPVRIDVICVAAVQVSVTAERYTGKN